MLIERFSIYIALLPELTNMIGNHDKLYYKLMDVLRKGFANTGCFHYSALRLEAQMCLHDANVDYIARLGECEREKLFVCHIVLSHSDPCHDLAWCLDACGRDRHLDVQQATKLKALLDKRKFAEEVSRRCALIKLSYQFFYRI